MLLRRLSMFVGDCTFEPATIVQDEDYESDFVRAFSSLVDHSVLRQKGEVQSRIVMLETVREYAAESFVESKNREAIRRRAISYFCLECMPLLQLPRRHFCVAGVKLSLPLTIGYGH